MFFSLVLLILLLIYVHVHFNEKSRLIDKMFPGPFRIPFIGVMPFHVYPLTKFYTTILEFAKAFNHRPIRIWRFHVPYIFITDSRTAKIILSKLKFGEKADVYKPLEPWLGQNHFLGSGEKWLKYRKFAARSIHLSDKASAFHLEIFHKNFRILYQKLKRHDCENASDIKDYMAMYALDNICESVTGIEMKAQMSPSKPEFAEALECMEDMVFVRNIFPILTFDWIFNLTPVGRRQKKSIQVLRDFSQKALNKRRDLLHSTSEYDGKNKTMGSYDISYNLAVQNVFTDEEIQIELENAIFGGHDTMSSSLSFLIYALAEHQEIQEKVYSELEYIFREADDGCPTAEQISNMKYTEQFINETLRYYTVAPLIGRYIREDVYINEHQFIPKNTNVVIGLSAVHRDPADWPNPDIFDPDRFSEEISRNRDRYTFLPFSCGPRDCLGKKYAMLEMKFTIAMALRHFKFSLSDNPQDRIRPSMNMVITSANGFRVKIKTRESTKSGPTCCRN